MADINRIDTTPSAPASTPSGPNAVESAANKLGQRIEQTTEGVESVSNNAGGTSASSTSRASQASTHAKRAAAIPDSEEELIEAIESHLKEQIIEVQTEINTIKKKGGRGMAYHLTLKVTELRQLHAAIKSLYEMAKAKLLELYKAVFKLS